MNRLSSKLILVAITGCLAIGVSGCSLLKGPTQNPEPPALTDTDKDGKPDITDDDIDGDGVINKDDPDIDGDNIPNTADTDLDGDGVANINDNDIDGDGIPNPSDTDLDGDGAPNTSDTDLDNDGIPNIDDNDLDGDGIVNTVDSDLDGDGIPNMQDSDIDNDGIANGSDVDIDGDGIVNNQDSDIDGDGSDNASDATPDGTGDGSLGTQGGSNTGADANTGTANSGADQDTGDNNATVPDVSGVVVQASHDMSFVLRISQYNAGDKTSAQEVLNLADIRDEIEDNDIDLPSAYISSATVTPDAASLAYIAGNANVRCVLKVYFQSPGKPQTRILMMQTPPDGSPVGNAIKVGDLQSGVSLNHGLYVVMPGYVDYVNIIKNSSVASVEMVGELEFLEGLNGPGLISLEVSVEITGKKAL